MGWNLDRTKQVSGREYINTFREGGLNIWRISIGNCAPKITGSGDIDPLNGNRYRIKESQIYDSLIYYVHQSGMRIVLNPCLDCDIWVDQHANASKMAAVKKLIEYNINRWSAYVDIIEIANEPYGFDPFPLPGFDHLPLEWLEIIVKHIRQKDPYGHLLAQDLLNRHLKDTRYIKYFDVLMPHWYHDGEDLEQDSLVANRVRLRKTMLESLGKPMPILYGEQGYQISTRHHNASPRWQRIRYWTAIFSEAGFISWHQN